MIHNLYKSGRLFMLLFIIGLSVTSCDFDFELPEAGSIADATPPRAAFSFAQTDAEDYRIVSFSNESVSATDYVWDFGGAATSTEKNPSYTYPGEGSYTVTLTASDKNGVSDEITIDFDVIEPEEPDAIIPEVINGDFADGQDGWKISSFTGGTTSPFNSSSDGSFLDYDGNDTGAKTAGAKWTMSTSAEEYLSDNTRFAYQAFTVSPNTSYTIEWEYAIKNDVDDAPGGDRLTMQILNGHFSDGKDALESDVLSSTVGNVANGKGNFTLVKTEFESNGSGEIAIWLYGVTNEDAYVDNVKLYPTE